MKYKVISPKSIDATIELPSSKSIVNRSLIISYLCGADRSCLGRIVGCDDTDVLASAIDRLHNRAGGPTRVMADPDVFDIGAAGTAMRFLTALLATVEGQHLITGTERMKQRPIRLLVDALRSLGADIEYAGEEGFPPLHIGGRKLEGGVVSLAGNVSSQYVSALLLIAPSLRKGLTLKLEGEIASRPYIDMTLGLMRQWGADASWADDSTVVVLPQPYQQPAMAKVERDWSAAAFWLEMASLYCDKRSAYGDVAIRLAGLSPEGSLQGDSQAAAYFQRLGATSGSYKAGVDGADGIDAVDGIVIGCGQQTSDTFSDNFSHTPDLAQAVIVACCLRGIRFSISGLRSLRIKETNRIAALQNELHKLGFVLAEQGDDTLVWDGTTCVADAEPVIDTYEDHRMAMAFAPAAITLGSIIINHPEVVSKSYPSFWHDLQHAGFIIEEIQ